MMMSHACHSQKHLVREFAKLVPMFVCLIVCGCNSDSSSDSAEALVQVAFDQQSKQAFAVDVRAVLPVPNPTNPRSQLKPALYCPTCQKWYPAPPLDVINRTSGAGKCPKTGNLLTGEGPIPDATLELIVEGINP